jgi:hypothetical protein
MTFDDLPLFATQSQLDKLASAWEATKADHPNLLSDLAAIAIKAKQRGFHRWSADALFHVLRWETGISTDDLGLKVNNNYTALASRDLMRHYPELDGMFTTRQRKPRHVPGQVC